MTKIRLDAKNDFEEYLRMYCMPTKTEDNENYKIIERSCKNDC